MKHLTLFASLVLFCSFLKAQDSGDIIPRPEHPKPQFVREQWLNLNGTWDFVIDNSLSGMERAGIKMHLHSVKK